MRRLCDTANHHFKTCPAWFERAAPEDGPILTKLKPMRIIASSTIYSAGELQRIMDALTMDNPTPEETQSFIKVAVLQASIEAEPETIQGRCWIVRYAGARGPEIALYVAGTGSWLDENLDPVEPPADVRQSADFAARR